MRIQPRTKQKKEPIWSAIPKEIKQAIARDSIRWGSSKSWIAICALGAFYDIDVVRPYELNKRKKAS